MAIIAVGRAHACVDRLLVVGSEGLRQKGTVLKWRSPGRSCPWTCLLWEVCCRDPGSPAPHFVSSSSSGGGLSGTVLVEMS